jgi:hypothetical protein
MDMPALLPLDSSSNSGACYCQRCLSKRVAAQLERLIASKPHTEVLAKAALYRTQSSAKQGLLEYIDYHPKSEQLTAWYHLKRGYCCDNNCQHCPYPVDQD